jgi:signal peptidase II
MKKRDWVLVIGLVPAAWIVDVLTKMYAVHNFGLLKFYGPFGVVLHRNPGAILGAFSHLPPLLRVVSLSTGGMFLIFIYAAIQYLLPARAYSLRLGMSLLLGGILGNVTDRILWGSVIDFMVLGNMRYASPAFNFADAIQWVGYGTVVWTLMRDSKSLWPDENERKQLWINPSFQLKYCFVLMFVGLAFALICGVFSYTYLRITIDDLAGGMRPQSEGRFLTPFLFTFSIMSMGFVTLLFLLGRSLSHRTAGPLYAFERFLEDVLSGKDRKFKLREGDEFTHLVDLAERVRQQLNERPTNNDKSA